MIGNLSGQSSICVTTYYSYEKGLDDTKNKDRWYNKHYYYIKRRDREDEIKDYQVRNLST